MRELLLRRKKTKKTTAAVTVCQVNSGCGVFVLNISLFFYFIFFPYNKKMQVLYNNPTKIVLFLKGINTWKFFVFLYCIPVSS